MQSVVDKKNWQIPIHTKQEFSIKHQKFVLLVITWNEGDRLKKQLHALQNYLNFVDIVIVDGGSEDGSTDVDYLKSKNVRTLITCNEIGLSRAIRAGFAYCLDEQYVGIITIDSNGKDDISALPLIIDKLSDGYDLVQASRFIKGGFHKNTPLLRLLGIFIVIIPVIALSGGYWYSDPTNGFKGLSTRFLLDSRVQPIREVFVRFNLQYYLNYRAPKCGFKTTEIPATRVYPDNGLVPTKIYGLLSHLQIIYEVIKTAIGGYDP